MLIRKLFKFEGAHVVRNCTSRRCALSIHGHSYTVELFLEGKPDNGQMVYDFGLLKNHAKELVDAFDHTFVFWDKDDQHYIKDLQAHSDRWISLPVNPSAEMLSLWFLNALTYLLLITDRRNNEQVSVHSVIVHETATGYAQSFRSDMESPQMEWLSQTVFSPSVEVGFSSHPPIHVLLSVAPLSWRDFDCAQRKPLIHNQDPLKQVRI